MSKILVTGGAGAIGSNLVRSLADEGHSVTIVDDLSSGHVELVDRRAQFVQGSITEDGVLDQAFKYDPEYVVHMAALFANQNSVDHPGKDLDVNGFGTVKVLEKSAAAKVKKFVFTSSSCVYGHKEVMVEDDVDFMPDTPYAITKLLGERYCKFWASHFGLDVAIVRLFNCYGPNEYPGRYRNVIPNFFQLACEGKKLPITGTGEETRDFNFVDDTVEGIKKALFGSGKPGEIYNLASGRDTKIIDLANAINELTGNTAGVEFKPSRSWDHVKRRRGSVEKAKKELGYEPEVSLKEGLKRTYDWFVNRGK